MQSHQAGEQALGLRLCAHPLAPGLTQRCHSELNARLILDPVRCPLTLNLSLMGSEPVPATLASEMSAQHREPEPEARTEPGEQPGMVLQAQAVTVARKGKVILNRVSFQVRPNTLTAIIGPNGAGKSTLMRALAGERPDEGQVLVNGYDIYREPEFWLQQIGYVPVDSILHEYLTLEEALTYIGRLRLPRVPQSDIESRVSKLLTAFGFPPEDDRRHKLIRVLSSGELKRANVCSELIVDPNILMLDEPTSNLDPNAEYELMSLLAAYAHRQHKTILVITHTLNTIELCDDVIFIENAELRAMGKPKEMLAQLVEQYGVATYNERMPSTFFYWAQVFEKTKTRPAERKDYAPGRAPKPGAKRVSVWSPATGAWWSQFGCLLSRYMRIRVSDRWGLVMTLLAGFSGLLFFVLPGKAFVRPFEISERALALSQARQSVYLIALVVTLLGMITSYTEISREFRIYAHERLKGLSPSAYFLSKWVWLTGAVGIWAPLVLIICIVLVYQQPLPGFPELRIGESVGWWGQLLRFQLVGLLTRPASWVILITLVVSCITSVTIGLLISCAAGNSGKGYLYLSFAVVFVVLFSGLIRNAKLEDLIDTLSFLSTGKWAYEGIAASLGLYCWTGSWRFDEFNSTGHLLSIGLSLASLTLAAMAVAIALLHVRDPWHRAWANIRLLITRNRALAVGLLSVFVVLLSYAVFLRSLSREYHALSYWSRSAYGGTNAYQYADIRSLATVTPLEYWAGLTNQSWCAKP